MGIYGRDYMRPESGGPGGNVMSGPANWSVLTWLLVINGAVFIVQHLFLAPASPPPGWAPWGGLIWRDLKSGHDLASGHVYLLITHMFVHGSLMHLLFNGIGIFFIGRILLGMLSPRHFLYVYFGAGVLGGIAQLLFSGLVENHETYLVGASGCAYGLLCALAALIPNQVLTLLLFFVIPIKARMRTIAGVAVVLSLLMVAFGLVSTSTPSGAEVGHMAHLGGALFGWLFIAYIYPRLSHRQHRTFQQQRSGERFGSRTVVDADIIDRGALRRERKEAKARERELKKQKKARTKKREISAEADAILDKINEHGFQSLTDEEKKILEKHADSLGK